MKRIVVISGATATGKTSLAIDIAKELNGEIISADSVQVYKHVDIGSAKPTPNQLGEVPHHLISCIEPGEKFSAFRYQSEARKKADEIIASNKLPLVVGGTGLYIDAILFDMQFTSAQTDSDYRRELAALEQESAGVLHKMLAKCDAETAAHLHPNDTKRLIRALEVLRLTGMPMSAYVGDYRKRPHYEYKLIFLTREREKLYASINERVDRMIDDGLIKEVAMLLEKGIDVASINAIGYKEVLDYLCEKCSLKQAIELIKMNTRRYAKRQETWLRKYKNANWFNIDEYQVYPAMLAEIIACITHA